MKKLLILFTLTIVGAQLRAQVPQGINYQAVARNAQGLVIPTQNISVKFSILEGAITGPVLYQETHAVTTNNYGLFTLVIGGGTATTGTFIAINWASGTSKFLKVEIAPQASGSYDLQGTTQLLSVPYALYSEKTRLLAGNAINITGGNTISANYSAGTGINIAGSTISGNYTGGTGINVTGSSISHALTAGTGINITGATISGAYQAGNGINITGNTIAGAYTGGSGINVTGSSISHALTAGTGINITGATISGNYTGGTGINVTGSNISHALTAGTGINITGATISHNLVAGTGVNITGNVISAPGSTNYWLPHANGIYYNAGRIGVGKTPHANVPISVLQANSGVGEAVFEGLSDDVWHTAIAIQNNPLNIRYTFTIAGPINSALSPGSFGLFNNAAAKWSFISNQTTNNFGLGIPTIVAPVPKSTLHLFTGDVNIEQIGSGIIMKSPNGQCWRVTVDNTGNLVRTAITCP
jgi:hypothetical protein